MKISNLLKTVARLLIVLPAKVYRFFQPDLWIMASRPDEADGNALTLFNWIGHKKRCVFVLNKEAPQYQPGMIQWGSLKHLFFSAVAAVHVFDGATTCDVFGTRMRKIFGLPTKQVFLQHGMTRVDIPLYHYEKTAFDLVIATNHREFEYLREVFHYPAQNIAITGMARHDDLLSNASDQRYILIMPTWRKELRNVSREEFKASAFYEGYQSILNNELLLNFLRDNNMKICFYLHYMIHDKRELFSVPQGELAYNFTDSVHELLRSCSLLVTDYSSVAFDAALAGKPIIYYQFQEDTYDSTNSYFRYDRDGFGPAVQTEESLINQIIKLWNGSSFVRMPLYKKRSEQFFEFHDTNNCQRIFDKIEELLS